jgi:hypothetical protein
MYSRFILVPAGADLASATVSKLVLPEVAEFDTRAAHLSPNSPDVELGGTRTS